MKNQNRLFAVSYYLTRYFWAWVFLLLWQSWVEHLIVARFPVAEVFFNCLWRVIGLVLVTALVIMSIQLRDHGAKLRSIFPRGRDEEG